MNNAYRSRPIRKSDGSAFDDQYRSFPNMNKNKKKDVWPTSIYDKLSKTTKAADCSKSIITASTAIMLDRSDSLSTTPTSPGGSGHSKGKSPGRGRVQRRGRSPTAIREGTNSKSRKDYFDDGQHEYLHLPGTQSTAPLSDGVKSAPSTPSRLNERRKQEFRARSWGNRSANKSIMGINNSDSDSTDESVNKSNSDLGLAFYKNRNGEANHSPLYDGKTSNDDEPSPVSSRSTHSGRQNLFPKTSPHRLSYSPGRQPRSQHQYAQQQQEQTYSTSLQQIPKTPDRNQYENDLPYNNNSHPYYPTESEAGSPTEIIENRSQRSSHYYCEPTVSEAGAPTEITKNHTSLRKPYQLGRPSSGDGGNKADSKNYRNNNTNDILSRVRSRFHNQQKQQKQQLSKEEPNPNNASMPSLLDSSSSCASSTEPMAAAPAEGGPASVLSQNTRLSRHVENARKKSILSPSPSDATSLPSSIDNETFGSTSLTTNIGSAIENNLLETNPLSSTKPSANESTPKQAGLMRRPVGARVAALESQYRRGQFTARGARPGFNTNQELSPISHREEEASEGEMYPDPILSPSYSLEDNIQSQYKQSEEAQKDGEDNVESSASQGGLAPTSYSAPDPYPYEDDFEESPLPEYIRNQGEGNEFVAYNDRQTANTDGIFQLKSKGRRKTANSKKKKADVENNAIADNGRHDREGKSPIQPLFSSERLDENNSSSIRESSIRSKSLGRSAESNEVKKTDNKRSKSLSERSERKQYPKQQQMSSSELSQAMKAIAKERKRRNQMKQKEEIPKQPVPGNIVINNEESNTQGVAEVSLSGSSITQSSIRSPPSKPTRALGEKRFLPSPGEGTAKAPRNQQVSENQPSTSIKDKIRAFNLKKSPNATSPLFKGGYPDGTNRSKMNEEKKEDGDAAERFNANRNNLERKSLWARYYVENLNKQDEDENNSDTDDDFSVSSLRDQLEQKIAKTQNDGEAEDDDGSVKSLRDMFEPATKKQTGDAVNQLKARFEPKPKAHRLSFAKQARLQRERSKQVDKSTQKQGNIASDPPESNDKEKPYTESRSHNSYGVHKQPKEQPSRTGTNMGARWGSVQETSKNHVFGLIEKRHAPLKDNNRKVPGYQWVGKGDSSDGENSIQKKGTKDSSDSSEAVTLDPSFAEVSNLSNPSALQSLSTEQEELLGDSSSGLFENLDSNLSSGDLGVSNSGLAIPELKETRKEVNNPSVVSGSSLRNYRNLNTQNLTQHNNNTEIESSHRGVKEERPQIVTPDSRGSSVVKKHYTNRTDHEGANNRFYSASVSQNDVVSPRIVSPVHQEKRHPAHTPSPGLKALNASRRSMLSSDRTPESYQSGLVKTSPYQNSETSSPSVENSYRGFDFSNRSSRSSDAPSSYRSARSTDSSNRSRGLQESPGELTQSVVVPRREGEFSDRSTRSSGLSSFHENSSPSIHKHNLSAGSPKSSNLPSTHAIPPIPSPFDQNYAAIMESRHKMLLVRQRTLLNRRANREKAQKYQQGFFGRTNPGKTEESTSLLNSTYLEPRLSDELKDDRGKIYPEIGKIGKPSNPSSGWETPPTSYSSQRRKETNEAGQAKSPVASMLSKIRPTFNAASRKDYGPSQTQAVIDRISAVRAARLRRNYAYGKVIKDSNSYGATKESGLPKKLGANHKNAPGYRYYPHTDMDDFGRRDGDESLSTFESNPQDYAARFALD